MVPSDVFLKPIVSTDVKRVDVKEVDIGNQFTSGQEFEFRMLEWIHTEASKWVFGVVFGCSDNRSNRRLVFVTMNEKELGST